MAKSLRVLIGCEYSGTVRRAFDRLGHDAWSCDLLPAADRSNRHFIGDVRDYLGMGWDLLMVAHPPCFTADTSVLTVDGYKPISDIKEGDMVLTHLGRWRAVKEVMVKKTSELIKIKSSNGLETITTPDHPYYTKSRREKTSPPQFINAGLLNQNYLTGSTLVPIEENETSLEDLWLMGRYLADGHMRKSRWTEGKYEEMVLSIGKNKFERDKINFSHKKHNVSPHGKAGSVLRITFYGHEEVKVYKQFGMGAKNKKIPNWVLALPIEKAKAFLDGYLSGDGYQRTRSGKTIEISCATISKNLALAVGMLMQKVYKICPTINKIKKRKEHSIEGRKINASQAYAIRCLINASRRTNYAEGNYAWGKIHKIEKMNQETLVYNLSVKDDETYTANGIIVHNCTRLCNSGVRWLHEPPTKLTAEHYSKTEIFEYKLMSRKERLEFMWKKLDDGAKLFSDLWNAPIERIAIENPVMHGYAKERILNYEEFTQSVQPYEFGHRETKRTCLWLKNLPALETTTPELVVEYNKMSLKDRRTWARVHNAPPGPKRWAERSKFFDGVANAMALQWAGNPEDNLEKKAA